MSLLFNFQTENCQLTQYCQKCLHFNFNNFGFFYLQDYLSDLHAKRELLSERIYAYSIQNKIEEKKKWTS